MLRDIEPFEDYWRRLHPQSGSHDAVVTFVRFLQKKLGAQLVYDREKVPNGKPELADLFDLAEKMRSAGIILTCEPAPEYTDEPFFYNWVATFREGPENTAGGCDLVDERQALIATLAETLERHTWYDRVDYFVQPMEKSVREMQSHTHIDPRQFAGFTADERKKKSELGITPESVFLWIRGTSITHGAPIWIPAQAVSAHRSVGRTSAGKEPIIRVRSTNGLATHVTRERAILHGALELVERDSYMITWLNQISAPRYDNTILVRQSPNLAKLFALCERYRLRAHIMRLPTDAPAHAVLGVIEDLSEAPPRFSVGLKASQSPAEAAYGAIIEALRARRGARAQFARDPKKILLPKDVGHRDRLLYWAQPENSLRLAFLVNSPARAKIGEPWEKDTATEHLSRLSAWCKECEYDFASVSFASSYKGLVPWHTEMVVIPQLQPMNFTEKVPQLGGKRLHEIPKKFGYKPRSELFTAEPHPFS